MKLSEPILAELKYEASSTRKVLERLPEAALSWKPHEKSRSLGELASHIAGIPGVFIAALAKDEFDRLKMKSPPATTAVEILNVFDEGTAGAVEWLNQISDDNLRQSWRYKYGDRTIFEMPRLAVIRGMGLNHMIHHRGQLTVYLRLLNVPVPGMYGPSADE
jgi:uncharacterized damage-inducible protein DinB